MLYSLVQEQWDSFFLYSSLQVLNFNLQIFSYLLFPGFSWLAKHVDMAGKLSSIPSFGGNFGLLSFPPVAGVIFFSWIGPIGIYYLALGK